MSTGNDRDFAQVLKESFNGELSALNVNLVNSLIPLKYDSIQLSYTMGNLTEVVYKQDGSTIAILNLTYDGSNNLIEVDRS